MNIAIIGAGRVGTTLAHAWKRKDHHIFFGVRNPNGNKSTQLVAEGFQVGTVTDASSFGDVVVLATPWRVAIVGFPLTSRLSMTLHACHVRRSGRECIGGELFHWLKST